MKTYNKDHTFFRRSYLVLLLMLLVAQKELKAVAWFQRTLSMIRRENNTGRQPYNSGIYQTPIGAGDNNLTKSNVVGYNKRKTKHASSLHYWLDLAYGKNIKGLELNLIPVNKNSYAIWATNNFNCSMLLYTQVVQRSTQSIGNYVDRPLCSPVYISLKKDDTVVEHGVWENNLRLFDQGIGSGENKALWDSFLSPIKKQLPDPSNSFMDSKKEVENNDEVSNESTNDHHQAMDDNNTMPITKISLEENELTSNTVKNLISQNQKNEPTTNEPSTKGSNEEFEKQFRKAILISHIEYIKKQDKYDDELQKRLDRLKGYDNDTDDKEKERITNDSNMKKYNDKEESVDLFEKLKEEFKKIEAKSSYPKSMGIDDMNEKCKEKQGNSMNQYIVPAILALIIFYGIYSQYNQQKTNQLILELTKRLPRPQG